ncbi:MAG TPA: malic enzyme-like NAD(P)-binding protein [Sedimentisphaerales bacterium]|nr:malic enzyme-like NAD(P)-binding protein [Sedimentisphaerales bacterium]
MLDAKNTSWQERYHASEIFTLRCNILDKPGMLGKLITTIGHAGAHVGNINVVGLDSQHKLRDITIYCRDQEHLNDILDMANKCEGIKVINIKDDVLEMHRRGTIEVINKVPITNLSDLRMLYTPGVASVCERIKNKPDTAWEMTGLCDRVAIVTNGTAVLGLGNIGTLPSLPVMEGKSAIFAEFVHISAFPILVDSKDIETVVETVTNIASGFGAIQLEDISAPACFEIEKKLKEKLDIPVLHDDQHGTATVTLAALINAMKRTKKEPKDCSVIILGAGAAGYAIAMILKKFGIGDIVVYDSAGPLYRGRTERMNPYKLQLTEITNKDNQKCDLKRGFKDKDVFIGVAQPNIVTSEMIASMARGPIVFPLSNPVGEIGIEEALAAGAAVVGDGRSINNALVYPGLFRGALDGRAKRITSKMLLAAAQELARLAPKESLLPNMLDRRVHKKLAETIRQLIQTS